MQRQRSAIRYASNRHDTFEPYRWVLGDVAQHAPLASALPQRTRLAACMLALLGAMPIAAVIVGSFASAACQSPPLPLRLGESVETTMTLKRGTQCPVRLLPGEAGIKELTVGLHPEHGELSPRGMTGVTYRPVARFKGGDSFSFSVRGKSGQQEGTMVVGVNVFVE